LNWLVLYIAIAFEVAGTAALKLSDGVQKPWIFAASMALYIISLALLSHTLKSMPLGITYAIWSGVGTLLIVLIGIFWFGETFTPLRVLFMAMIIIGAIGLNLSTSGH